MKVKGGTETLTMATELWVGKETSGCDKAHWVNEAHRRLLSGGPEQDKKAGCLEETK